ncbi:MAG TPA: AIR synthase-related protein, partial [Actinomycetota bacterium]|nr:AIR synthase-related protein [Actinomycetota bacterium]
DVLIGFNSSGLHSNGYTLVRKVIEQSIFDLNDQPPELDRPLGEVLLTPTIIYWNAVAALQAEGLARGFAHITGGGLAHNLGRIIPPGFQAVVERSAWTIPAIFRLIGSEGVSVPEMFKTFNMGIGMVGVVDAGDASRALEVIRDAGYRAQQIGVVRARPDGAPEVILP